MESENPLASVVVELIAVLKRESIGYQNKCNCKWCKEVLDLIGRAERAVSS